MKTCDACGVEADHTMHGEPDLVVCSQDCFIDYIADVGYLDDDVECRVIGDYHRHSLAYCDWCNKPFVTRGAGASFCSQWCSSCDKVQELESPPDREVPASWWKARRTVLERDDEQCQFCGKPRGLIGRRPDVVCIDENGGVSPDNLICLCPSCHEKDNNGRTIAKRAAEAGPFNHDFDAFLCPMQECSEKERTSWFDTYKAMAHHYRAQHEERATEVPCRSCGTVIQYYPSRRKERYCASCYSDETPLKLVTCQDCGEDFVKISIHWASSECSFPTVTDELEERVHGYVLGAGRSSNGDNTSMVLSVDEELASHVADELGLLGATRHASDDYYGVRIRQNPTLEYVYEWVTSGTLSARSVSFSPMMLRCWYVANGVLRPQDNRPILRLSNSIDAAVAPEIADAIRSQTPLDPTRPDGKAPLFAFDAEAFFRYVGEPPTSEVQHRWP